jgi:2-keto-4-pentenoate hydratase/2-oxohepta-3-ene-1,7-dioic acid hydratase in catechol pathway
VGKDQGLAGVRAAPQDVRWHGTIVSMKIARFSSGGDPRYGILDGDELVVLRGDPMFAGFDTTEERVPLASVKLLAPVIPRSKVVAVGKNYVDHVAEFGGDVPKEPLLFLKPNTSVVGPGDAIVLPPQSRRVDFEGELAVVIGSIAKNVRAEDAASVIFGYTIANDVTARDLQKTDGQWARAKGFDSFCPLGPIIETEFELGGQRVVTRVNGEVRQDGTVDDMVHSVADVIAYASAVFTLLPGDVILTGTPAGVGPIVGGDVVEVEISGIGTLSNPVRG